jgi:hypothetical protein
MDPFPKPPLFNALWLLLPMFGHRQSIPLAPAQIRPAGARPVHGTLARGKPVESTSIRLQPQKNKKD